MNETCVLWATERNNKAGKCSRNSDKERLKIDARIKFFEVDFRGLNEMQLHFSSALHVKYTTACTFNHLLGNF